MMTQIVNSCPLTNMMATCCVYIQHEAAINWLAYVSLHRTTKTGP